jgi:AmiR/NasT family two-component response regulator
LKSGCGFARVSRLHGAFGRRAVIEHANGILMARSAVDCDIAFGMLRDHSQHNGRKLTDVAAAIIESRPPLVRVPASQPRQLRKDARS